jgi:hypothetical protein
VYGTYHLTMRRVLATIAAMEKQCVTYSECLLVALDIKHAMRMRRIVIFGLSGCTEFFLLYLINENFRKKKCSVVL